MKDADFSVEPAKRNRFAKICEHDAGGKLVEATSTSVSNRMAAGLAGAGLFSTIDDFARFVQMLCKI